MQRPDAMLQRPGQKSDSSARNIGGLASPLLGEDGVPRPPSFADALEEEEEEPTKNQLGTINGVFVPCLLNILGAVLFLRIGYAVGYAGIYFTVAMFLVSFSTTVLTAFSFSAIVTNGKMQGGGPYYMISRAIGPAFGGATGLMFYLCYVFNCAFNATAFVEDIEHTVLSHGGSWPSYATPALYHSTLAVLGLVAWGGAGCFSKVNIMLFCVLIMSIVITFFSLVFENNGEDGMGRVISANINCFSGSDTIMDQSDPFYEDHLINATYYGPGSKQFISNLYPHRDIATEDEPRDQASGEWDPSNSLPIVVALIFTSTCGVLEGANLSGDLKNPALSLPKGTLSSQLTAFIVYIVFACFLAASFDRDSLRCDYFLLQEICASEYIVVIGMGMATLSTALGALFGGARVLQAIARDKIFPGLTPFGKGTVKGDEPNRAVLFTWVLANAFGYIGGGAVNGIAAILTDFFLTAYFFVNVSALLLFLTASPNWRPTFTFTKWYMSALGAVMALSMMWYLSWLYAIITIGIWLMLFTYLSCTVGDQHKDWGDITQAIGYRVIRQGSIRISPGEQGTSAKFWRSNLILLAEYPDVPTLRFCQALTESNAGLFLIGTAVTGGEEEKVNIPHRYVSSVAGDCAKVKSAWGRVLRELSLEAFSVTGMGKDALDVYTTLISSAGLGGLVPRSVIVPVGKFSEIQEVGGGGMDILSSLVPGQPFHADPACFDRGLALGAAVQHLALYQNVLAMQLNLVLVRNMSHFTFPLYDQDTEHVYIDVWIIGKLGMMQMGSDLSLRLQLAHLLHTHHAERTRLRLMQVVPSDLLEHLVEEQNGRLHELALEARVPTPKVMVLPAPSPTLHQLQPESTDLAVEHYRVLGQFIASHSARTAATFLPLLQMPSELSPTAAELYLESIEALTAPLPPVVLCRKQEPNDIFSSDI